MVSVPFVVELQEACEDAKGHRYVVLGGFVVVSEGPGGQRVHRPHFICTDESRRLRSVPMDMCRFVGPRPVLVQVAEPGQKGGILEVTTGGVPRPGS
jgi:hypothetical protein